VKAVIRTEKTKGLRLSTQPLDYLAPRPGLDPRPVTRRQGD
jgi:hypothetical protein